MRDPQPFEAMSEHGEHAGATGLLWFINRAAFHPLGFALAFHYKPCETCDGEATIEENGEQVQCPTCEGAGAGSELEGWSLIGNGTEPFYYEGPLDDEGFHLFRSFIANLPHDEEAKE